MIKDIEDKEKRAYLAGIFDGEGCVCIRFYKNKPDKSCYFPYIGITNTNKDLIDWLVINFGGYTSQRKGRTVSSRDTYDWRVTSSEDVLHFIEKVYKYLVVKKKQCQVMMNFLHRNYTDNGKLFYEEISKLNHGDVSGHTSFNRISENNYQEELS